MTRPLPAALGTSRVGGIVTSIVTAYVAGRRVESYTCPAGTTRSEVDRLKAKVLTVVPIPEHPTAPPYLIVVEDPAGEVGPWFTGTDRDLAERIAAAQGLRLPDQSATRVVTEATP